MTDFSPRLDEQSDVPSDAAVALLALGDDAEIIEAVTKTLYPGWEPADGTADARFLINGRDTWRGIVEEVTGTRTT